MPLRIAKTDITDQPGQSFEIIRQLAAIRLTADEIAENPAKILVPRKRQE